MKRKKPKQYNYTGLCRAMLGRKPAVAAPLIVRAMTKAKGKL